MYNGLWRTFHCFKGLSDNMLSCLCQYLDGYIFRNQILIDQCAQESIFCFRCSRKSYFDLFKTNLYKQLEKLHLLIKTHRDHQRLVAITKIYRTPCRSLVNILLFRPIQTYFRWHIILFLIFTWVHHLIISSISFSLCHY